jgi:hypothetical protein
LRRSSQSSASDAPCEALTRAWSSSIDSKIRPTHSFAGSHGLVSPPHDPVQVIAWSRIYETMERVTDKSRDIADVLRGLVIKLPSGASRFRC